MMSPIFLIFLIPGFLLGKGIFDHSIETSTIGVWQNKKSFYGLQLVYEGRYTNEFLQPYFVTSYKHFHNDALHGGAIVGARYLDMDVIPGINIGYDVSKIKGRSYRQLNYGVEWIKNNFNVLLRHYRPSPKKVFTKKNIIYSYSHTDLDILYKKKYFLVGLGGYEISEKFGIKSSFSFFLANFCISTDWRYDSRAKHGFKFGFHWSLFSPKKEHSHKFSAPIYKHINKKIEHFSIESNKSPFDLQKIENIPLPAEIKPQQNKCWWFPSLNPQED